MAPNALFDPRWLGGMVARLAEKPDGGAEVVAWKDGAWVPVKISVGEVMAAPGATDERLAELGIPVDGIPPPTAS